MKTLIKLISLILLTMVVNSRCYSYDIPSTEDIEELKIGDKCPDFVFSNIVNSDEVSLKLSDFGDKLVIIDFWATWCGACISSLPKLNELQEKYHDKLVILTVTKEEREKVLKLIGTLPDFHLPVLYEDETLHKYFPHRIIPHVVWIDNNRMVAGITSDTEVTETSIDAFFRSGGVDLPKKQDFVNFRMNHSMLSQVNLPQEYFGKISFVTGHFNGISSHAITKPEENGLMKKLYLRNLSPIYLFNIAFTNGKIGVPNKKTVKFDLTDRNILFQEIKLSEQERWLKAIKSENEDLYCYEIELREGLSPSKFYDIVLSDLNSFFSNTLGIKAVKRKEKLNCWVLKKISDDIPVSKGGESVNTVDYENFTITSMNNQPVGNLIDLLNRFLDIDPFVDGTNYTLPLDLDLELRYKYPGKANFSYLDTAALDAILQKQGFKIVKEHREVDILLITDKL